MTTKLSRLFEAIIEAGWLAALIVTPLFFNVHSSRVFEPDKLSLLRSIALIMAVAWLGKAANEGFSALKGSAGPGQPSVWQRIRSTPLVLPTLILVLSYLVSTLLSVSPRISWWGSYQRMQGAYTTYSYIVIFFLMLGHLRRREQWLRIVYAMILTSLPIAFYGILQRTGADPLPWGGNVRTRIASNMGNSIFVAAYLLMVMFLTLQRMLVHFGRLLRDEEGKSGLADAVLAGCYLFILVVQGLAILFTQSRGPFLGLMAGLYVFSLVGLLGLRAWAGSSQRLSGALRSVLRWAWVGAVILAVAGVAFLLVFNLPNSPLAGLRTNPYIGRLGTALDFEANTARVRTLIWQGAAELVAPHEPLLYPPTGGEGDVTAMRPDPFNFLRVPFGYGPETMWVAFNRYYPPDLAYHESRNASPDRSHNETFDSLVITGVIGFIAYMALFLSVFYYSLKWLGLIRSRRQRVAFLLIALAGGALGALLFYIAMGNWILFGLGLPLGVTFGAILYITIAAIWNERQGLGMTLDQRAVLLITILATVVAHFVEIHFGIAIAATRTYFWAWSAILVVVGMGWLKLSQTAAEPPPGAGLEPSRNDKAAETVTAYRRQGKKSQRAAAAGRAEPKAAASITAVPPSKPQRWNEVLIYAVMLGIILFTLAYNFVINPNVPELRSTSPLAVFWHSLTSRVPPQSSERVTSLGILWMVIFTWAVGLLISLAGLMRERSERVNAGWPWRAGLIYSAAGLGIFLTGGMIHAIGIAAATRAQDDLGRLTREEILDAVSAGPASHSAVYFLILFVLGLVLALLLWRGRVAAPVEHVPWLGKGRWAGIAVPAVAGVAALIIIVSINLNLVQADTIYKVGQAYDRAQQYDSAIYLYRKAIAKQPSEDYYYLFLGRALLERARDSSGDVRQQYLAQAEEALLTAQALNPLNTDHSANLGRFFITEAQMSDGAASQQAAQQSLDYYEVATRLSPNAAHLHNEYGTAYLAAGDVDQAMAQFDISLGLDQRYPDTYRRLGDLYQATGAVEQAIESYQQALELAPRDVQTLSTLGYLYAQQGDLGRAIEQNLAILEMRPNDLASHRNLAILYEQLGEPLNALPFAQRALELAVSDSDKAALQDLIQQLQQQLGG
jgi:tetratricopeptide (TPR) repeat protein/O-antigen ligase